MAGKMSINKASDVSSRGMCHPVGLPWLLAPTSATANGAQWTALVLPLLPLWSRLHGPPLLGCRCRRPLSSSPSYRSKSKTRRLGPIPPWHICMVRTRNPIIIIGTGFVQGELSEDSLAEIGLGRKFFAGRKSRAIGAVIT
jgi:hypothetical protein